MKPPLSLAATVHVVALTPTGQWPNIARYVILARPQTQFSGLVPVSTSLKQLLTSAGGTFILRCISMALTFLTSVFLARFLGVLEFGYYNSAIALIGLLSVVCTVGIEHLIVRQAASYATQGSWNLLVGLIRRATQLTVTASIIISALTVALAFGFSVTYRHELLYGIALLPVLTLLRLRSALLQGLHKVLSGLFPEFVALATLFLAILLTIYVSFRDLLSTTSVLLSQLSASIVALLIVHYLARRLRPEEFNAAMPSYDTYSWLKTALPLLFIGGTAAVQQYVDIVMLSFLKGPIEVGLYRPALQIGSLITFASFAVIRGLRPIVSDLHAKGDIQALQSTAVTSARLTLAFALPVGAVVYIFSAEFVSIFGPDFAESAGPLRIFVIGLMLVAALGHGGIVLVMTGYEMAVAFGFGFVVICNIILNIILIPLYGIEGAALATMISQVFIQIVFVVLVFRKLTINTTSLGGFARGSS
jgi:O-antigen/teichoic acid export membrane protein